MSESRPKNSPEGEPEITSQEGEAPLNVEAILAEDSGWWVDDELGMARECWLFGGERVPHWRSRCPAKYLQDLPTEVPATWIKQARLWLDAGHPSYEPMLQMLFASQRMRPHWGRVLRWAMRHQRQVNGGLPDWAAKQAIKQSVYSMVSHLAVGGDALSRAMAGAKPSGSMTRQKLMRNRQSIANAARRLANALKSDPYFPAEHLPAVSVLFAEAAKHTAPSHSVVPETRSLHFAEAFRARNGVPEGRLHDPRRFNASYWEGLRAFAEHVEAGNRISDHPEERAVLETGMYRGRNPEQRTFERALGEKLETLTGWPCNGFIAAALSEILGEEIGDYDVGNRRRNRNHTS